MFAASRSDAQPTRFSRVTASGALIWRSQYFGPLPAPESATLIPQGHVAYVGPQAGETHPPQAFLVEQEAGAVVPPHFHYVDQFQVVVAGEGKLGAHAVAPLSVHFAGAATSYGPIVPGPQGLSYFTLRASADCTGAHYLPEARSRMPEGPRRNLYLDRIPMEEPARLAARTRSESICVLDKEDGLAVHVLRLGAHGTAALPDPAQGAGMSLLVSQGDVQHDERRYSAWACLYLSVHDRSCRLVAGDRGAEVLCLRYPRALA